MSKRKSAGKILKDRQSMYMQGVSHRRWGLPKYHSDHKHQADYDDGYYGRLFNKTGKRSIFERIRRAAFELFGV